MESEAAGSCEGWCVMLLSETSILKALEEDIMHACYICEVCSRGSDPLWRCEMGLGKEDLRNQLRV